MPQGLGHVYSFPPLPYTPILSTLGVNHKSEGLASRSKPEQPKRNLRCVPVGFHCCDKCHDLDQPGEDRTHFCLQVAAQHRKKPRQELQAGAWYRNQSVASWLAQSASLESQEPLKLGNSSAEGPSSQGPGLCQVDLFFILYLCYSCVFPQKPCPQYFAYLPHILYSENYLNKNIFLKKLFWS